jgi:hypothetical protein
VLPSRAVPPRRRGSCREQRHDDSRHERSREAAAGPALGGAQRDPIRARRHRERPGNGNRGAARCLLRCRRSFVGRLRREKPLGPCGRRAQGSTGLWGGRRRRGRLSNGMHRPLHVQDGRLSPRPRRCASPWPRRRVSRFRNRRGVGRRRDHDRYRRRRRRRLRPRHRFRRRRLVRRRRLGERRQEEERVEVPLRVGGVADAEVHVRHGLLGQSARTHRTNRVTLGDGRPAPNGHGAEMEQRDRVAVRRLDGDGPPAGRHGSGERDDAASRCDNRGTSSRPDVDPTVETARVRIGAEAERVQNRPLHWPGPPLRRCGRDERGRRGAAREPREQRTHLLPVLQTEVTVASGLNRCQI